LQARQAGIDFGKLPAGTTAEYRNRLTGVVVVPGKGTEPSSRMRKL